MILKYQNYKTTYLNGMHVPITKIHAEDTQAGVCINICIVVRVHNNAELKRPKTISKA